MDRRTTTALVLGTASLGLLVYGTRRARRRPSRRFAVPAIPKVAPPSTVRGAVVCPLELRQIPANLSDAQPGDFVAIRLADHAGTFTEVVWAVVESIHGKGKGASKLPGGSKSTAMGVRITGTIGPMTVATPNAAMHGFDVGSKFLLENNCAWELLHTTSRGMALCGVFGRDVSGKGTPAAAGAVVAGEEVLIYLAPVKSGTVLSPGPGWDVPNPVWARIIRVSRTKTVLRVRILEEPAAMPAMTLATGDRLDISRDCIFDVRPGGS